MLCVEQSLCVSITLCIALLVKVAVGVLLRLHHQVFETLATKAEHLRFFLSPLKAYTKQIREPCIEKRNDSNGDSNSRPLGHVTVATATAVDKNEDI